MHKYSTICMVELQIKKGTTGNLFLKDSTCRPYNSWTEGIQLYPQLSELPSWIFPTHLSIRIPPREITYIIFSNEKHSVTVLCRGN